MLRLKYGNCYLVFNENQYFSVRKEKLNFSSRKFVPSKLLSNAIHRNLTPVMHFLVTGKNLFARFRLGHLLQFVPSACSMTWDQGLSILLV